MKGQTCTKYIVIVFISILDTFFPSIVRLLTSLCHKNRGLPTTRSIRAPIVVVIIIAARRLVDDPDTDAGDSHGQTTFGMILLSCLVRRA